MTRGADPHGRPPSARRIFGLDFSGASDAGRRMWLAEGRASPAGLDVLSCRPVAELPGGGPDRRSALCALQSLIAATPDCIMGCDFPFSLPRPLIAEASWTDFIEAFDHLDAPAFRAHCRSRCNGTEPKRDTDREAKTPWCAFNIRLYRQSFHGMAELLRPLVTTGRAVALPMQPPSPGLPWLVEICPASALRRFGWRGSYKGRGLGDQRRLILSRLIEARLLRPLPAALEERVVENAGGDALDSILAALATLAALSDISGGLGAGDPLEGRVYFRLG